ncbi:hypothetical protein [Mycobacterium stomatepiae]|uniref:Serine/threonine-protein kinase PknD n=1 Tax=Mycobacterium stomatepiae TaxID=470076 RepID=A0A7I7QDC7_9MYCO|nr:hypothetical protein [Mycobacterium stomatepiae]MCV7164830.1 hypothetical protein [Mycobacterium stomatepiae]BBY24305.1 hypothetical protein MSTO_45100 [Mycobacterium stomatepiae]
MDDDWEVEAPAKATPPRRGASLKIMAAVIFIVVAVVSAGVYLVFGRTTADHAASKPAPSPSRAAPLVLPFQLTDADGLEVDPAGNVYVSDSATNQVFELTSGSDHPIVVPFTGLNEPGGLAVDGNNAVYVVDQANRRVLKLPAGSTTQIELPIAGLDDPHGIAVDSRGTVFVADLNANRVVELPPARIPSPSCHLAISSSPTTLRWTTPTRSTWQTPATTAW